MLTSVRQLSYAIVLCDDMERMKAFYRDLFAFPIDSESETSLAFLVAGSVLMALRQRTRPDYDGQGVRPELPGVQLAFLVAPAEVDLRHQELLEKGSKIIDSPTDQPRGHCTCYFSDQ